MKKSDLNRKLHLLFTERNLSLRRKKKIRNIKMKIEYDVLSNGMLPDLAA